MNQYVFNSSIVDKALRNINISSMGENQYRKISTDVTYNGDFYSPGFELEFSIERWVSSQKMFISIDVKNIKLKFKDINWRQIMSRAEMKIRSSTDKSESYSIYMDLPDIKNIIYEYGQQVHISSLSAFNNTPQELDIELIFTLVYKNGLIVNQ